MSSIRHDGHVLSSRKRYARTYAHARTFTFTYARAFTPILQRPQAHPRYSLVPILYVVYVRTCVCAHAVGGIHHCATNFRDKYFTDGHYAEIRVFARYKLWMWLRWRLHRPRGGQIVSTEGQGTRGDAIGCKGTNLMPVKFIRLYHDDVLNDIIFINLETLIYVNVIFRIKIFLLTHTYRYIIFFRYMYKIIKSQSNILRIKFIYFY